MLIVHSHLYMYLVCVNHMRLKHIEPKVHSIPLLTPYPLFFLSISFHFHGLEICKIAIIKEILAETKRAHQLKGRCMFIDLDMGFPEQVP
jgi:hypothetical protein